MIISDNLSVLLFREDVGIRFLCFILCCPLWLSPVLFLHRPSLSYPLGWSVLEEENETATGQPKIKNETTNRMKDK